MEFPIVYIINLKHDKKRLDNISNALNNENLEYNRIDAIYGKNISNEDKKKYTTKFCYNFCSNGMIGCGLSHIKAWKELIKSKYNYALILEDDAQIAKDFKYKLKYILDNKIPNKQFDILYLGCNLGCNKDNKYNLIYKVLLESVYSKQKKTYENVNEDVYKPIYPLALHGYIINKECAIKLLAEIDDKINYHFDVQINNANISKSLNVYAVKEHLITQEGDNETSNIANGFPFIFSYTLKNLKTQDNIPWSYNMSVPLVSIFGIIDINAYFLIYILIGIMSRNIKIDVLIKVLSAYYCIDIILNQKVYYKEIIVSLSVILLSHFIFKKILLIKLK